MSIGNRIREHRLSTGMTQADLADRIGRHRRVVSNYETGKTKPKDIQLEQMAAVLGISVLQLLYPSLDTTEGVIHALFYLRECCGLQLIETPDGIAMRFNEGNYINEYLRCWADKLAELENGEIEKADFLNWCGSDV